MEGEHLQQLQQSFSGVDYLIIGEMSMLGGKLHGQIDQRLCQSFPHRVDEALGGCSCMLVGDFGQLPPVMDLPLYSAVPRSAVTDLGCSTYQMLFAKAVVLTEVCGRWTGQRTGKILRTASPLEGWRGKCCRLGALDDTLLFSGGQCCF